MNLPNQSKPISSYAQLWGGMREAEGIPPTSIHLETREEKSYVGDSLLGMPKATSRMTLETLREIVVLCTGFNLIAEYLVRGTAGFFYQLLPISLGLSCRASSSVLPPILTGAGKRIGSIANLLLV